MIVDHLTMKDEEYAAKKAAKKARQKANKDKARNLDAASSIRPPAKVRASKPTDVRMGRMETVISRSPNFFFGADMARGGSNLPAPGDDK